MKDVYQMVTDRIIAELEKGVVPWRKPWASITGCVSHSTGKRYSLLNQMLLEGLEGEYATFTEITNAGGHVRKGEKSHPIVFFRFLDKEDPDTGELTQRIPFLRYYSVFNIISQCDGIKPKYQPDMTNPGPGPNPSETAESIITDYTNRCGIKLERRQSSQAFYRPSDDLVVLPLREQFESTAEYYSTVFHELTHSTGSETRLNRNFSGRFGSDPYAREELVAEIGAAYLVNHCGIETPESVKNNAAYIQSWIKHLKDDNKLIITAAGRAEKAVNLILNQQPEKEI